MNLIRAQLNESSFKYLATVVFIFAESAILVRITQPTSGLCFARWRNLRLAGLKSHLLITIQRWRSRPRAARRFFNPLLRKDGNHFAVDVCVEERRPESRR